MSPLGNVVDPVNPQDAVNKKYVDSKVPATLPALVTALPGSPVDGQEVYYQSPTKYTDNPTANTSMQTAGNVWHLRYRAAASGSYKWEFVGGSPLIASIETSVAQSSNAAGWVDLPSSAGPTITLPLGGDYEAYGVAVSSGAASANYYHQLAIMRSAVAPVAADIVSQITEVAGSVFGGILQHAGFSYPQAMAAAGTLKLVYNNAGGTNSALPTWGGRRIVVRPIRVG